MSETNDMTLIRDNYRVDWCFLDEGWNGLYDDNNPADEPLLRFDATHSQTPNGSLWTTLVTVRLCP